MTNSLPLPPVPADADLRDFPFTPILRARLFGSSFHARVTDSEWRAGVTLWLKSWEQVPAGSLPIDDIDLCRLAELGRDLKAWKKLKAGALYGWYECSDGRLYHKVVAEVVNKAVDDKVEYREFSKLQSEKGRAGAAKRWAKQRLQQPDSSGYSHGHSSGHDTSNSGGSSSAKVIGWPEQRPGDSRADGLKEREGKSEGYSGGKV